MRLSEIEPLAKMLADIVRQQVQPLAAQNQALRIELAEVKASIPEPVEPPVVEIPDLAALVKAAVAEIEIPKPEPVELPDIGALVKSAVDAIELPAVELPDVAALVKEAVSAIELPKPEPIELPDVAALVREAVAEIPKAADGRDALDIQILPFIDDAKSYPRGTFAKHDGGLFRSYEQTHGMRGWECIVEGIASLEVVQDGERGMKAIARLSGGKSVEHAIHVPVVLDRGVYAQDGAYTKGDGVTYGGSYWILQDDASDGAPGIAKCWRLSVKKGRDGKDLRDVVSKHDPSKGVPMK